MADDIYVYIVDLPRHVDEIVTPCVGGFTVYLASRLDEKHRLEAYRHALKHIEDGDFDRDNVQYIEAKVRGMVLPQPVITQAKPRRKRKPKWLRMMEQRIALLEELGIDPNEHAMEMRDKMAMYYPK